MNVFVPFFTADPCYKELISVFGGTFGAKLQMEKLNSGVGKMDTMEEKVRTLTNKGLRRKEI